MRSSLGRDLLFAAGALVLLVLLPYAFPGKAFSDFIVRLSAFAIYATSLNLLIGYGGLWLVAVVPLIAAYGLGTSVLQSAYQQGDALTAAGTATMVTNAVPIAAGFVLFGETLPHGAAAILQIAAFACLVVSAVALGHRQAPVAGTQRPRRAALRTGTTAPGTPGSDA